MKETLLRIKRDLARDRARKGDAGRRAEQPNLDLPIQFLIQSRRVFIMNTILLQGVGADSLISEGKALIPYGESYP